jgi:hypothetical protein
MRAIDYMQFIACANVGMGIGKHNFIGAPSS